MRPENIPEELKDLPNWVCYMEDKKPIDPMTGRGARANDPMTWGPYDLASSVAVSEGYAGIGFEFGNSDYAGVDIDECIDDAGNVTPEALAIVNALDSYTEISPSGHGLHIIVKAPGFVPKWKKKTDLPGMKALEMYAEGRYFTVTGELYSPCNDVVAERTEALTTLHDQYIKKPQKNKTQNEPVPGERTDARPVTPAKTAAFETDEDALTAQQVITMMRNSGIKDQFRKLYDHGDTSDYGGDDSAADMALCNHLAFWTSKDPALMDEIFRSSGLMRPKWDRSVGGGVKYGERTIQKAIEDTPDVWRPRSGNRDKKIKTKRVTSSKALASAKFLAPLKLTPLSEIEEKRLDFLIHPYIPKGRIVIIYGNPGSGKTYFSLYLADVFAAGKDFITDDELTTKRKPMKVLYLTRENEPETEIKPRLRMMGCGEAAQERIMILDDQVDDNGIFKSLTDGRLEEAIRSVGIDVAFIDPIQSYLDGVNMNAAEEMRPVYDSINRIAKGTGCTFILLMHPNKQTTVEDPLERILGSMDSRAAARSILVVGVNPDCREQRVIAHGKASASKEGRSIAFHIGDKGVEIEGLCDLDRFEITNAKKTKEAPKRQAALNLLLRLTELRNWTLQKVALQAAAKKDVSENTLREARNGLGIESRQHNPGRGHKDSCTVWYQPNEITDDDAVVEALELIHKHGGVLQAVKFLFEEFELVEDLAFSPQ
jgi:KaiC/GvpD/RAD55 family RecA-like ATPase